MKVCSTSSSGVPIRLIVFLNLGDQPALPFMQLDAMPVDEIAKLFEKFKVAEKKGESGDDEAEEA